MHLRPTLAFLFSLAIASGASAAEIREFDLKTTERLGNELSRVSQQPGRGATTPARKRAVETAKTALQGKLFDIHYDYVVLDDPAGGGFLVYALGKGPKRGDVVVHGHFRVTVSAHGRIAERVDALSKSVIIENKFKDPSPGFEAVAMVTTTAVTTQPMETIIYASNMLGRPIFLATVPNRQMWIIENGKIKKGKKINP